MSIQVLRTSFKRSRPLIFGIVQSEMMRSNFYAPSFSTRKASVPSRAQITRRMPSCFKTLCASRMAKPSSSTRRMDRCERLVSEGCLPVILAVFLARSSCRLRGGIAPAQLSLALGEALGEFVHRLAGGGDVVAAAGFLDGEWPPEQPAQTKA